MGTGALNEPGRDVWHVGNFSIRYPAAVSVPVERGQARIEGMETAECVFEEMRIVPNLLLRQEGGSQPCACSRQRFSTGAVAQDPRASAISSPQRWRRSEPADPVARECHVSPDRKKPKHACRDAPGVHAM